MSDFAILWSHDQILDKELGKQMVVTEADVDAALLKGMCMIMEMISRENEKIMCESCMEGDGITIKIYETELHDKKLVGEIRNIRAKEVWNI